MSRRLGLGLVCLLLSHPGATGEEAPPVADAADSYQSCAVCHLAGGEGVPGAFPPLKGRIADIAATPEGRNYLIAVINTGLVGNIVIDAIPYTGAMPGQGSRYDEQAIRDVLNYSVRELDGENLPPGWRAFTTEEIRAVINAEPPTSAMDNARLRRELFRKYPHLN